MSITGADRKPSAAARRRSGGQATGPARRGAGRREAIELLIAVVAVMWIVELVNSIDGYKLNSDGIRPHNVDRIWGIFTAPFLHVGWGHLIGNTIPLVFMGLIIAMEGLRRLAAVTAIVIVVGGLGTWLLSSAGTPVVGASGIVFGYATYLLARGFFRRNVLELLVGAVVVAVWGTALLASLVPHGNVSWQGHLSGAIAGILSAWALSGDRRRAGKAPGSGTPPGSALAR
jgi:membrane associated rhomboid family serine protease